MTVAYHRRPVLWDVDLDVPEGRLVAIVGPNGAGKSTLVKCVMGFYKPTSGQIQIDQQAHPINHRGHRRAPFAHILLSRPHHR